MSDSSIEIVERDASPALTIRDVVGTIKLSRVMGPAYATIKKAMVAQDATPPDDAIPFCIYRNVRYDNLDQTGLMVTLRMMFKEKWDIEMGIPSEQKLEGGESVKSGELPGGKFLRTIHPGPYRNLRATYKRIADHAAKENLTLAGMSVERYLNSPHDVAEAELQTEVLASIE